MEMESTIREALDAAGYHNSPPTVEELRSCFMDYVAAGYWRDLDFDAAAADVESGEITTLNMCRALKKGR